VQEAPHVEGLEEVLVWVAAEEDVVGEEEEDVVEEGVDY
jgi:hypothetical protein